MPRSINLRIELCAIVLLGILPVSGKTCNDQGLIQGKSDHCKSDLEVARFGGVDFDTVSLVLWCYRVMTGFTSVNESHRVAHVI